MINQQYKFPCDDFAHDLYKWGIEYANDIDGFEVVHVEWFTTEEERNQVIKGTHATDLRGEAYTFEKLFNQHSKG